MPFVVSVTVSPTYITATQVAMHENFDRILPVVVAKTTWFLGSREQLECEFKNSSEFPTKDINLGSK